MATLSSRELFEQIEKSANIQETLRDVVFSTFREINEIRASDAPSGQKFDDPCKLVQSKLDELYEILGNLDEFLAEKSPREVASFFSSLLDVYNQLYLHHVDGVISVKMRLIDHITPSRNHVPPPIFYHEIPMIYTPEEIRNMQKSLEHLDRRHPLYGFFTGVLDQAFDANHFNETSSFLLLEITNYLITQLEKSGNGEEDDIEEFKNRHLRAGKGLEKTVDEFRELESIINEHLRKYPILTMIPNLIRSLIQIRLGIVPSKFAPEILRQINDNMRSYNQAKRVTAFDFNRLHPMQYSLLKRQEVILKLQQDILEYTGSRLSAEFTTFFKEYKRMMGEIETQSQTLNPDSPEYTQLAEQKKDLQQQYESRRKQMDVVNSQKSLIESIETMMHSALKRFDEEGSLHGRIEESLKGKLKVEQPTQTGESQEKKNVHRMAAMDRRNQQS